MKHFATAFAFVAMLAGNTPANDGYAVETGAAINFSKSTDVQMVQEDIRIDLLKENARVRVDFVFRNHGGEQTVLMAFPDNGYGAQIPTMKKVRSWVDGVPVQVKLQKAAGDPDSDSQQGLWTKSVHFRAGQTRKVRMEYETIYSWSIAEDRLIDYVLRTGATWHGPIWRTSIVVDWSNAELEQPPAIHEARGSGNNIVLKNPSGLKIDGKQAHVTYRNFVPDFDLSVELYPGFWNFELNGEAVPFPSNYLRTLGDPDDLLMPVESLGMLFADNNRRIWAHPAAAQFGGSITFPSADVALLGGRRTVSLKRQLVTKWRVHVHQPNYGAQMVRLKDLVSAIGGSYQYDPTKALVIVKIPR